MNRIINKRQAVCGTVWVIIVCAVLSMWPLRLIRETIVSDSNRQMVMESGEIMEGSAVQQMFAAQYDRLKNINIYLTEGIIGEEFNFVLYDASMGVIMQQVINTKDMKSIPGDCRVQVNIDTDVGQAYYFAIQGMESPFRTGFEETASSGNPYNGASFYGGVEDREHSMIASYEYEVPLRKGRTLMWDALFVLSGILVTWLTGLYYKKHPERNTLVTVEKIVKVVCNPLIVLGAAGAVAAVWPCRLFSTNTVSNVFFIASILLAAGFLLYAVNHDRTGYASDRTFERVLRDNWQNYLQSALFAGAIWACCNYMNGLFELHHTVAYRQMLVFLALAVLVTYQRKYLFNVVNLVYCVIAAVAGWRYYQKTLPTLENPQELDITVLKLTVWVGILTGLVLIGTVRALAGRRIKGLSLWYSLLVGGFFVLIIVYRNTRGWPIYLVCAFTLFYLNMAAWEKKAALLRNICNGILFHFGAMVVYCLLHRPYMFFRYYRYPFIFHTVTISAVYLAMVVCAALVKFLDVYRRTPRLAAVYKELAVLGVSAVYLLFTLSRTGYLAIAVTGVILIPVMCLSGRQGLRRMLRSIGMMALAVALCFPVTFTAQRMVPAVVARPQLHEIEELPVEIVHGRDMDSYYYITIQRFIQVFQMKILGIPEEESLRAIYMVADAREQQRNRLFDGTESVLLASTEDTAAGVGAEASPDGADAAKEPAQEAPAQADTEEKDNYTNGRMEIFRAYYKNLNKIGHDDMGIMEPDGNFLIHAHNIYLQVAYDHGIYVGAAFILLGAGTLLQAAFYFGRHREDRVCAALPLAILILFAVAGLTEWIFHPCCPIACCLLLVLGPLLIDSRKAV